MDLIREMSNILEQDLPKSFNLIIPKGSKLRKLYKLALETTLSERDIASELYQSDPGDKRFLMLKGNLINKLSELVLIANHSDINRKNYIKVKFQCEKQLTIAKKLLFVNVYHNAEKMTKKVLKQAQQYELVDVERECYNTLRKIYYLKGFSAETRKYQKLTEIKFDESRLLDKLKGLMEIALADTKFIRSQSSLLSESYAEDLAFIIKQSKNPENAFFQIYKMRIQLIIFHQSNNINRWETTLETLGQLLQKCPYLETEHFILEANISKIKYLIATHEYVDIYSVLDRLIINTSYKSFNRFEVMAEAFQLEMHLGNFNNATKILEEVSSTVQYPMLDKRDRAAWSLRAAYCKYLHPKASVSPQLFDVNDLHEFYGTCAGISKDKTGYNLQFVIIRTLQLYQTDRLDYASEVNNLKVYFQRYLKGNEGERTKAFYKSLSRLVMSNFCLDTFETESDRLKPLLSAHAEALEYCEIIRYETLWVKVGHVIAEKQRAKAAV
ncbi:MAG: hypothetical protein ABJN36_09010 [Cyclobacteriaceae bacterium]